MFRHDRSNKWLSLSIKITITTHFALIIMKGYFFFNTYSLGSVDVNNTYMRIRKMILIMLYKYANTVNSNKSQQRTYNCNYENDNSMINEKLLIITL